MPPIKNWSFFDTEDEHNGNLKWVKGNGDKVVTLSRRGSRRGEYPWKVVTETFVGGGSDSTMFFRTKKRALRFARSYIKRH